MCSFGGLSLGWFENVPGSYALSFGLARSSYRNANSFARRAIVFLLQCPFQSTACIPRFSCVSLRTYETMADCGVNSEAPAFNRTLDFLCAHDSCKCKSTRRGYWVGNLKINTLSPASNRICWKIHLKYTGVRLKPVLSWAVQDWWWIKVYFVALRRWLESCQLTW